MDLISTLELAQTIGVNLEIKEDGGLKASPGSRITPELDQAIRQNRASLIDHLLGKEEEELLSDIAQAGITLRVKNNGTLYASPLDAVEPLRDRIAKHKDALLFLLKHDNHQKIRSAAEARLLVRSQFDTEPHTPVPTVKDAWTDPSKAEFFRSSA